ncbi:MAG: response regulator [Thermodesulfobacteriota bacterium]
MTRQCEIMILDDELVVCERLQACFQRDGHQVEFFVDPAEAIKRLEEKTFDIVVSDLRMGEINGLQVLDHVLAVSPRTKVILITGYATLEVARGSLTKGAFDFIAKPFKLGEIRKTIKKAAEASAPPAERGIVEARG